MKSSPIDLAPVYAGIVKRMIEEGWQVQAEGPLGAQLQKPRKMRVLDKIALVLGFSLVAITFLFNFRPFNFFPWGCLFIAMALVDFMVFTRTPTYFVFREAPESPWEKEDLSLPAEPVRKPINVPDSPISLDGPRNPHPTPELYGRPARPPEKL